MSMMTVHDQFNREIEIAEASKGIAALERFVKASGQRELAADMRIRELESQCASSLERNNLYTLEIGELKRIIEEIRKSWSVLNGRLKALEGNKE